MTALICHAAIYNLSAATEDVSQSNVGNIGAGLVDIMASLLVVRYEISVLRKSTKKTKDFWPNTPLGFSRALNRHADVRPAIYV